MHCWVGFEDVFANLVGVGSHRWRGGIVNGNVEGKVELWENRDGDGDGDVQLKCPGEPGCSPGSG